MASLTSLLHCKVTAMSRGSGLVRCCLQSIIHQSILPFVGDCQLDCSALVFSCFCSAACVHVCLCVAASVQAIVVYVNADQLHLLFNALGMGSGLHALTETMAVQGCSKAKQYNLQSAKPNSRCDSPSARMIVISDIL